jgi:hypothetical protein
LAKVNSRSRSPTIRACRSPFAVLGQGQIGPAGVLTGEAPGGFAVPGQVNYSKRFAHDFLLH